MLQKPEKRAAQRGLHSGGCTAGAAQRGLRRQTCLRRFAASAKLIINHPSLDLQF